MSITLWLTHALAVASGITVGLVVGKQKCGGGDFDDDPGDIRQLYERERR